MSPGEANNVVGVGVVAFGEVWGVWQVPVTGGAAIWQQGAADFRELMAEGIELQPENLEAAALLAKEFNAAAPQHGLYRPTDGMPFLLTLWAEFRDQLGVRVLSYTSNDG